ncbi:MAG: ChrR family anti-sigma-E factor [Pseudomonadota bacterium]
MSQPRETSIFGELYSGYAAGRLEPGFALLVETQAALRSDVAERVQVSEAIASAMLEREAPAEMGADALDRAFAAIDQLDKGAAISQRAATAAGAGIDEVMGLPEPLRDAVLHTMNHQSWQFTTPGIRRLSLDLEGDAETELYRLEPGVTVPRHTHAGSEFTLVVTGGFADELGAYGPGDLSVKGPEHTHQPVADMDGICYALAVRNGGLQFTGLVGAMQRILGV